MDLTESEKYPCKWQREHPPGAAKMLLHNGEYYFCRTCDTAVQYVDGRAYRSVPPIMDQAA